MRAVTLPGYDVKILPISGVMQGAIFWELMESLHPQGFQVLELRVAADGLFEGLVLIDGDLGGEFSDGAMPFRQPIQGEEFTFLCADGGGREGNGGLGFFAGVAALCDIEASCEQRPPGRKLPRCR